MIIALVGAGGRVARGKLKISVERTRGLAIGRSPASVENIAQQIGIAGILFATHKRAVIGAASLEVRGRRDFAGLSGNTAAGALSLR